jgi:hypothetical protein
VLSAVLLTLVGEDQATLQRSSQLLPR